MICSSIGLVTLERRHSSELIRQCILELRFRTFSLHIIAFTGSADMYLDESFSIHHHELISGSNRCFPFEPEINLSWCMEKLSSK